MKILAVSLRIIQQMLRDKRSLGLIFIVPLMVLWLFSIILTNGSNNIKVGAVDFSDNTVSLLEKSVTTVKINSTAQAEEMLKNNDIDAYITIINNHLNIRLEGSDISKSREVIAKISEAFKGSPVQIDVSYLYGKSDMDVFDTTGPVFLGFFAFFFVFLLSGISFVRERLSGTLERVLVSPIKRIEIVLGYVLGFGIFALIESVLVTYFTVHVLNMYNAGHFIDVLITTCIISLSALTLGSFLSAFAGNEFQVMQFIPVVIVPQVFFTGLFPVDNLPTWLTVLGKLFPLTYGADILRNIMFKGERLSENLFYLGILILFCGVFILLNMLALKKQRQS